MPLNKPSIQQLAEQISPTTTHSDNCTCLMCMKSKISVSETKKHKEALAATMVDRRNPDKPERPLMKATIAHAIVQAGTAVDMLKATGLQLTDLPNENADVYLQQPAEVTIRASWKERSKEQAVSGADASVFGGLGVLLVPPGFNYYDIPKLNAKAIDPLFLKTYGGELVSLEEPVQLDDVDDPSLKNLYLVQYDFDKDYIEQYVMKMTGGGGLFVEKHPFPHVFTPLASECSGAIILGQDLGRGQFKFAAFQIPFGYSLKLDSNVIHGDSFFVGPYAIALTETELADSVLFRQRTTSRDIQQITQTPVPTIRLPLLAEYRLTKAINHQLMIDKLRHDHAAKHLPFKFFQRLPTAILIQVEKKLPLAAKAIKQRNTEALTVEQAELAKQRTALKKRFNSLVVHHSNDKPDNTPKSD